MTVSRSIHVAVYSLLKNPLPEATFDSVQRKLYFITLCIAGVEHLLCAGTPVVIAGGWDTKGNNMIPVHQEGIVSWKKEVGTL